MATKLPDTINSLLYGLHQTYDFGPAMNKRIKASLKNVTMKDLAPPPDALLDPPRFITQRPLVVSRNGGGTYMLELGMVHGFRTVLFHSPNITSLKAGCCRFASEKEARRHWPGNVSVSSRNYRPHATALIDYVAAICKHRGWTW